LKKQKDFRLNSVTDLKVFLLFLLDNIRYPIDGATILDIVQENTGDISLDYHQSLSELVMSEHLHFDEIDGVQYYMISDKGRRVAAELYDNLDEGFREKSLRSAIRHISLSKSGATVRAFIEETEDKRFRVTMQAADRSGEIMSASLTVPSRSEAEEIRRNFEAKPDGVYRGLLFSVTGRIEFLS